MFRKSIKWLKQADDGYLQARQAGLNRQSAISAAFRRAEREAFLKFAPVPCPMEGTFVDVGTNQGQVLEKALIRFRPRLVVCIEPLPGPFAGLQQRYGNQPHIHLFNCAVGRNPGMVELHVNRHDQASSVLPIRTVGGQRFTHRDLTPVGTIPVEMQTLDQIAKSVGITSVDLLKIDVQGYELEALSGALDLLPHVHTLLIEVSFYDQYAGQVQFHQLHEFLHAHNFNLRWLGDFMRDANNTILQADAVYVRN